MNPRAPHLLLPALPVLSLLGRPGSLVDLRGTYFGMGTEGRADWGMLALILSLEEFTIFVKMTGPAQLVGQERENFISFCASLGTASPDEQEGAASVPAEGRGSVNSASPLSFSMPAGWRDAPRKSRGECCSRDHGFSEAFHGGLPLLSQGDPVGEDAVRFRRADRLGAAGRLGEDRESRK